MDQRLQYEELIAGKLQQLPVPDMQDQIWERIKFQLDLDMPEAERSAFIDSAREVVERAGFDPQY